MILGLCGLGVVVVVVDFVVVVEGLVARNCVVGAAMASAISWTGFTVSPTGVELLRVVSARRFVVENLMLGFGLSLDDCAAADEFVLAVVAAMVGALSNVVATLADCKRGPKTHLNY